MSAASPTPSGGSRSTGGTADGSTTGGVGASAPPVPISTVASAGPHNAYIWRKLDWFFPWRLAFDPAPQAPTEEPGDLPQRYGRAALLALVLGSTALCVTNLALLPLQLVAYALVVSEVLRSRGHVARWNPYVLRASECIVGWWMGLVATLLEAMGMQVQTAGDLLTTDQVGEGALIIANHPSTADWVYIWSWLLRQGDLTKLKIVLKASLHKVPVVGWALQTCRYLFLHRQWQQDREHMSTIATHWAGGARAVASKAATPVNDVQLLLFPEGTDLRPLSFDQSSAFVARDENRGKLTPFQHVLQPRITGFVHMVKLLRATGSVKAVYDLTVATDPFPITIENLLRGVLPRRMHFHVKRFELSSLPQDDAGLAAWLLQQWQAKDQLLDGFYSCKAGERRFDQTSAQRAMHESYAGKRRLNLLFRQFSLLLLFGWVLLWHAVQCWEYPIVMTLLHAAMIVGWIRVQKQEGGFDALILKVAQASDEQQAKLDAAVGSLPSPSPSPPPQTSATTKKAQ